MLLANQNCWILINCTVKIEVEEHAVNEFNAAIEWYERQTEGLGKRFKKIVLSQIKNIKKNPTWFLHEEDNIYKVYIPKFPYKILYTVEEGHIIIWAFMHMHRKPGYWKSRKTKEL